MNLRLKRIFIMSERKNTRIVLTIAGSDSSGGAGIQADIKTISALGLYACSAITAVTSQNTLGVKQIHPVPYSDVLFQIRAVMEDLEVNAIKIGMLFNEETTHAVKDALKEADFKGKIILDPVMQATSGATLAQKQAIKTMTDELFPLADLITPNLAEASLLCNMEQITDEEQMRQAALYIKNSLGAKQVLIKGGHLQNLFSRDIFLNSESVFLEFDSKKLESRNTHGTGCTLSSAIASYCALGHEMPVAIQKAKTFVYNAIENSMYLNLGRGHGSLNHFFNPQKLVVYEGNRE